MNGDGVDTNHIRMKMECGLFVLANLAWGCSGMCHFALLRPLFTGVERLRTVAEKKEKEF